MGKKDISAYAVVQTPLSIEVSLRELEWVLILPLGHPGLEHLDALVREAWRRVPTADRGLGCTFMVWPEPADSMIFRLRVGKEASCAAWE